MTVQPLRPPVVAGLIAAARDSVASVGRVPAGTMSAAELADAVTGLEALAAQVASVRLRVLAEADRRDVAEESGATGTDAWAAALTGSDRAVMAGGLWLARLLEERYHATCEAFAEGRIGEAQVRVIVRAAEQLPAGVTEDEREAAEIGLVDKAVEGLDPQRLRRAARRMVEVVSAELADRHEATLLEAEERRAEAETWMTLRDNGDGTFSGRFCIPELHGHLLRSRLELLSAPRRLSLNRAGKAVVDETLLGGGDRFNWSEQLGAAFTELLEHLPGDGHGQVGATLLVHLDLERLRDGLASARLDTGTTISAGEARRLGCGAGLVPLVLGGASEILDVGRLQRLHTLPMRRALSTIHETCAAEGCRRPFAWCEIHHPHSWLSGGGTSVGNALPLCGHHHRRAHDSRYDLRHLSTGEVRFRRRT
jgi:hypothetical protein